jgi:hypothetical protein
LRFFGRFIVAQGRSGGLPNGKITVLAANYDGLANFEPHLPLMVIRRDQLAVKDTLEPKIDLAPSLRFVNDGEIQKAEYFGWDLSGRSVRVRGRSIAQLPETSGIADLSVLEDLRGRLAVLDPAKLVPGTGLAAKAAIAVAGAGRTDVAFPSDCNFVTLKDATDNNDPSEDEEIGDPAQFADLVEFDVDLPKIGPNPFELTLELTEPDAKEFKFSITVTSKDSVVIAFSNRCPTIPSFQPYDLEFGQYFEVLQTSPGDDRLVPKEVLQGGSVGDCDRPATILYDV